MAKLVHEPLLHSRVTAKYTTKRSSCTALIHPLFAMETAK
jgi:hypothetical protein